MRIPTNLGPKTEAQVLDALVYSSFAANRDAGMSADQYARLLRIDVSRYESKYQKETQACAT